MSAKKKGTRRARRQDMPSLQDEPPTLAPPVRPSTAGDSDSSDEPLPFQCIASGCGQVVLSYDGDICCADCRCTRPGCYAIATQPHACPQALPEARPPRGSTRHSGVIHIPAPLPYTNASFLYSLVAIFRKHASRTSRVPQSTYHAFQRLLGALGVIVFEGTSSRIIFPGTSARRNTVEQQEEKEGDQKGDEDGDEEDGNDEVQEQQHEEDEEEEN